MMIDQSIFNQMMCLLAGLVVGFLLGVTAGRGE